MKWENIQRRFWPNDFQKAIKRWFNDEGDKTLRLNYDLDERSVVFDLGGYEGQWAADIYQRYHCMVYVFEPVREFYEKIVERFAGNSLIRVHPFGLSDITRDCEISLDKNGSSVYHRGGTLQTTQLVCAKHFITEQRITEIALMKINIEGGEYDLLESLLLNGIVPAIKDIQVQFHDIPEIPGAKDRMHEIQKKLAETHQLTYQYYPFVWENWRRK